MNHLKKQLDQSNPTITSVNEHDACAYFPKNDIGLYVNKANDISVEEKNEILVNLFIPDRDYVFKRDSTSNRSFRFPWLQQYNPWLTSVSYTHLTLPTTPYV